MFPFRPDGQFNAQLETLVGSEEFSLRDTDLADLRRFLQQGLDIDTQASIDFSWVLADRQVGDDLPTESENATTSNQNMDEGQIDWVEVLTPFTDESTDTNSQDTSQDKLSNLLTKLNTKGA